MAQVTRSPEDEEAVPNGFESIYQGFIGFLDRLGTSQRLTYSIVSLVIAAVLIAVASLPILPSSLSAVYVLIGFPAGIIVFLNVIGYSYFTGIRNTRLFGWKERSLPARRIRALLIATAVVIAGLITLKDYLPHGLGGVIVITYALIGFNLLRRTPEELRLARLGLPDPRELVEEEEDE